MTFTFTLFITLISIAFLIKKKYTFLIGAAIIYSFYLFFLFIEYKLNFQIKNYIILLVLLTIVGHLLIGQYFDFYNKTKYFDKLLHVLGAFSFSLFSYSIISKVIISINPSQIYTSIFVVTIGITFGVFLEIIEFVLDCLRKTKNQKGLRDTNFDLIFNVIGSTLAGFISFFINF